LNSDSNRHSPKYGTTHQVTIEKLVYKGLGLGTIQGKKTMVHGTLPGDILDVKIIKKKRDYLIGEAQTFKTHSHLKKESACQHFPTCGGCQWMNVGYQDQLKLKTDILLDASKRVYPELLPLFLTIIPSPEETYYRNKMEFAFSKTKDGSLFIGLKKRGEFDQVVPIKSCLLQSKQSNEIISFTSTYMNKLNLSVWDYKLKQGFLRYLMIRHSKYHDKYMVNLIVSEEKTPLLNAFAIALNKQFSNIKTIYASISESTGDNANVNHNILLLGPPVLKEKLSNFEFSISPTSFFQTNTKAAEILYSTIVKAGNFSKNQLVLDLYCGTGSIGIFIANHVNKVIGIEENPSAILDAINNAKANQVNNIQFIQGRVKNILKNSALKPDVIVIDPPRSGLVPKALSRIASLSAKKIIYVSCNPVAMLRDLLNLKDLGYKVRDIQPVDMFPNTYHIECVVRLDLQ